MIIQRNSSSERELKMADDSNNKKRKFKKSRYVGANKKKRGLESLAVGMKGVLVTCNEKEKNCVREAYNVLNEYADKLYGSQFESQADQSDSSEEEDIEQAIAKERQDMKKDFRRFQSVKSGAKNVIFVRTMLPEDEDPDRLVHGTLTDILENGYKKTRHCMRFLPIGVCCYAKIEEIEKAAEKYFYEYFFTDIAQPTKFCVIYKSRNNDTVHRDDIVGALARLVLESGKDHSVDLKHPDLTICVEIIRNICCLTVVKDFHKLKRYNIQEVQHASNKKEPIKDPQDTESTDKDNKTDVLNSSEESCSDKREDDEQKLQKDEEVEANIKVEKENTGVNEDQKATKNIGIESKDTNEDSETKIKVEKENTGVNEDQEATEKKGIESKDANYEDAETKIKVENMDTTAKEDQKVRKDIGIESKDANEDLETKRKVGKEKKGEEMVDNSRIKDEVESKNEEKDVKEKTQI